MAPRVHVSVAGWIFPYVAILNAYGGPHPVAGAIWTALGNGSEKKFLRAVGFLAASCIRYVGSSGSSPRQWLFGWALLLSMGLKTQNPGPLDGY